MLPFPFFSIWSPELFDCLGYVKKCNNMFTSEWLPKVSICMEPSGTACLNFRNVVLLVSWKSAPKCDRINTARCGLLPEWASGTEFRAGQSSQLCHDKTAWWYRKEKWRENALSVRTVSIERAPPYGRLVPVSLTDVLKVRILSIPNFHTQKMCVCECVWRHLRNPSVLNSTHICCRSNITDGNPKSLLTSSIFREPRTPEYWDV